eukprot:scaffold16707_cov182-Amphora_coffeaeformis.AAC.4
MARTQHHNVAIVSDRSRITSYKRSSRSLDVSSTWFSRHGPDHRNCYTRVIDRPANGPKKLVAVSLSLDTLQINRINPRSKSVSEKRAL